MKTSKELEDEKPKEQIIDIFFPMSEKTIGIPISDCSYVLSALRGPDNGGVTTKAYGTAIVRHCVRGWKYGYVCNLSALYGRLHEIFKDQPEGNINLQDATLETIKDARYHYASHIASAFLCLKKQASLNYLFEDLKLFNLLHQLWAWKGKEELKALYEFLRERAESSSSINFSKLTPDMPTIRKDARIDRFMNLFAYSPPKLFIDRKTPIDYITDIGDL